MKTKKQTNKKKLINILIALSIISVSVWGAYVLSISSTLTGQVTSEEFGTIFFTSEFNDFGLIDTTNNSVHIIRNATIQNNNGEINTTFTTIESIVDDPNDSCNNTGDVTIKYFYEGLEIFNDDTIIVLSGESVLNIEIDFVRSSCPSNVSVATNLIEVVV